MLNEPDDRPNCKEILDRINLWGLTGEELKIDNDLHQVLNSNDDFIYYIAKSKLIFSSSQTVDKLSTLRDIMHITDEMDSEIKLSVAIQISKGKHFNFKIFLNPELKTLRGEINGILREFVDHTFNQKMISRQFDCFENYSIVSKCTQCIDNQIEKKKDFTVDLNIEYESNVKSLIDLMEEIHSNSYFSRFDRLTEIGFYLVNNIFIKLLRNIQFLHLNDPPLILGNLQPCNILFKIRFDDKYSIKFADFGFTSLFENISKEFRSNYNLMRNEFSAPELVNSERVTTKTDIYSLGEIYRKLIGAEPDE